jgi:carboxypeptidase C (cathepsin A)
MMAVRLGLCCALVVAISAPTAIRATAQEPNREAPSPQESNPRNPEPARSAHEQGQGGDQKGNENAPVPPERAAVTHHEMTLGGKPLKYTATAGTLLIRDEEDKPYGSMFYVAYTLDGAQAGTRPVSFLYNGGPGSATLWLHMGSFSPVRIQTDSPKATAGPPFNLLPNQDSLLDKTDLVFIDAPLTGYSRAVGKGQPKDFTGVDQDLRASSQ